ncbi:LIM-domain-containing protein [Mycena kentingensis (nom. inval.)]|nr:LIM-domain-containing protein [Mycena kentingensis (nom. inval.)]
MELDLGSVFPEEPRPATPEPTIVIYQRDEDIRDQDWRQLSIKLVGSHPLWGHHLWNAGRAVASFIDHHRSIASGYVLELGAGGGLPGLAAAKNGAKHVLLTDYPDTALIHTLETNVQQNAASNVSVKGYIWGRPVEPLLDVAPGGFDLIILSDLVFNHSQHAALLDTCIKCLAKTADARVLVFYTHHRPHLASRDLEFFQKARERGWTTEQVVRNTEYGVMFEEDGGDAEVRSTVHGWELRRADW